MSWDRPLSSPGENFVSKLGAIKRFSAPTPAKLGRGMRKNVAACPLTFIIQDEFSLENPSSAEYFPGAIYYRLPYYPPPLIRPKLQPIRFTFFFLFIIILFFVPLEEKSNQNFICATWIVLINYGPSCLIEKSCCRKHNCPQELCPSVGACPFVSLQI